MVSLRILVLGVHYEVTGARYIADAFTRLGHDVKHVGIQGRLKDAWGVDVSEKYIWKSDVVDWNNWTPDLAIIADTNTEYQSIPYLQHIPVIVWSNDNHVRNSRHRGIDHYFLAHYHGQAQPVSQPDETWLPCATDIFTFPPSNYNWENKKFDFCCIGVMYPDRARRVQLLKDAGYKVFAATGLVYDEYRTAYQNARIALCSSFNGDLAQRVFEGAGMGCLVFTDLLADLVDSVTNKQLGLHGFVSYNDDDELLMFANSFLRDPAEIPKAIAGAKTMQAVVLAGHKWTDRAQVVVDWYQANYGGKVADVIIPKENVGYLPSPSWEELANIKVPEDFKKLNFANGTANVKIKEYDKPYLNLGCGRTHFPSAKPAGHEPVDDAIYDYPLWLNVDKVDGVGADKVFDLFTYPWPLESDSYDGAVLAHLCEHIPHNIQRAQIKVNHDEDVDETIIKQLSEFQRFETMQDGWFAFFSELYRVLTPGALVHIVSPYGRSDSGIVDPSHTRYLTLDSFTHSMTPEAGETFKYNNGGIHFVTEGQPVVRVTDHAKMLADRTGFSLDVLLAVYNNVAYDFYIKLKVVK